MRRLLKLKKYLDIHEAAHELSLVFGELVSSTDIYRFALEKHLILSVELVNNGYARECKKIKYSDIKFREIPSLVEGETLKIPNCKIISFNEGEYYEVINQVEGIEGVLDVPMIGGERIDVQFECNRLGGRPLPEFISLDGVMLMTEDKRLYEVQSRYENPNSKLFYAIENFHPAGALPDDSVFVIRRENLEKFINQILIDSSLNKKEINDVRTLPIQRSKAQENEILIAIENKGYDSKRLPKICKGHAGIKAEIRAELVGKVNLFPRNSTVFDKAWQRLRDNGEIQEQ